MHTPLESVSSFSVENAEQFKEKPSVAVVKEDLGPATETEESTAFNGISAMFSAPQWTQAPKKEEPDARALATSASRVRNPRPVSLRRTIP